ncbi:MAG: HAD-IA family hydrolase [Flavobacteriaceae bacterium]
MIKTLIFDFGDVFINLNKSNFNKQMNNVFGDISKNQTLLNLLNDYETGNINTEAFVKTLKKYNNSYSKDSIIKLWNSIIADFPYYRVEFLKNLKATSDYKMILLSNTNELHINFIKEHVSFFNEFKSCFDKFYLSHEIKLRKPNKEIFHFVLKSNNISAEETLFIDDTLEHINTASKLNIKTWWLKQNEDITSLVTVKNNLLC